MRPIYSLAAIRVTGPEARSFLQGQLSNDLELLTANTFLLASCNSAQGRVQAILQLVERTDGILMLLPRSMLQVTITRLRKYQLRAKLSIDAAADSTQILWASLEELSQLGVSLPMTIGQHQQHEANSVLRWPDTYQERYVVVQLGVPINDPVADNDWQLADIRAGLPQVLPETHEHFVAQMLNLDVVGGISFNKGCYTGQEIIARAHFRGTVKRSMVRYQATCAAPLPGSRLMVGNELAGEVVAAANTPTGCEFLAVVSITQQELMLTLQDITGDLERLPLPYESIATS